MFGGAHDSDCVDTTEIPFFVQNIDNVCAVCLQLPRNNRTSKLQDVLPVRDTIEVYKLLESISLFKYSERIPQLLCSTCSFKLLNIYEFQQMCNKSYVHLYNYMKQKDVQARDACKLEIGDTKIHGLWSNSEDVTVAEVLQANTEKDQFVTVGDNNFAKESVENIPGQNLFGLVPESRTLDDEGSTSRNVNDVPTDVLPATEIVWDTIEMNRMTNGTIGSENQACMSVGVTSSQHDKHQKENLGLDNAKRHNETDKTLGSEHVCKYCNISFSDEYNLRIHMDDYEDVQNAVCAFCGIIVKCKHALIIHERMHTGEKPFKCNQCAETFGSHGFLELHEQIHHTEEPFFCERCGKVFEDMHTLTLHTETHRKHRKLRSYLCPICSKGFCYKSVLSTHMYTHFNNVGSNKTSKTSKGTAMVLPVENDGIINERNGELESSNTKDMSNLEEINIAPSFEYQASMYVDLTDNKHDAYLKDPLSLDEQESCSNKGKVTSNEHACKHCNKVFNGNQQLRNHINMHEDVHIGERPFNCSQGFNSQGGLWTHMQCHINDNDKSKINVEKTYKCEHCPKAFTTVGYLLRHRLVHSEERCYACTLCDKKFKRTSHLNQHMLSHSRIRPFVCTHCNKDFIRKVYLDRHLQTHI